MKKLVILAGVALGLGLVSCERSDSSATYQAAEANIDANTISLRVSGMS